MTPRIYVSGPMSGHPDLNFPAFHAAASALRAAGYDVVNPAEFGETPGRAWEDYLREDIKVLMDCTAVALLPGYKQSRGAMLELHIAQALSMDVRPLNQWLTQEQAA